MNKENIYAAVNSMCTNYCKWPYEWDEEEKGCPLNESDICEKCPLSIILDEVDTDDDT